MLRKIPFITAVKIIALTISAMLIFHVFIITGLIPYNTTWGGRLESQQDMYLFESVSILLNLLILWITGMKSTLVKQVLPDKIITAFLWIFTILFALNTLGNIFSMNTIEAIVFTPVTLLLSILFLRLAIEK